MSLELLATKIKRHKHGKSPLTKKEEASIIAEFIQRACMFSGLSYEQLRNNRMRDPHTVITRKALVHVLVANNHSFETIANSIGTAREMVHHSNEDAQKLYAVSPQFRDICHAYAGYAESVALIS